MQRPLEPKQYLSIRYTERLAANGVVSSVGSRGDSYDNATAESIIGLYKTELVRDRGPWKGLDDLELATLEWIDWFNHRRLSHELGHIPPIEYKANHYRHQHSDRHTETQTNQWCVPGRFSASGMLSPPAPPCGHQTTLAASAF